MPHREQELFGAALELSPAERAAFLASACGDAALRQRLERLLAAAGRAGAFLGGDATENDEAPGARLGHYRLMERVGDGGFGVVYRAMQEQPVRRTVALKIVKLGMDTRAVIARFEAERQALARMDHPHIARVFDAGATASGRPFFVMEFVDGRPITTHCRAERLSIAGRLRLFLQVCRAVHHAHQRGIIHRDLKPSNLLVATTDGGPQVKVIDFGIAKATHEPLTERTMHSRLQRFLGTPSYMSPEQVALGGADIDTRSDVFALGAVLHELLIDTPPLAADRVAALGYAEVEELIRAADFPAPSRRWRSLEASVRAAAAEARHTTPARLETQLRGDLDQIVLKCLARDRTQRYDGVEDLARDVERWLRQEPVHARPLTLAYRARMFVRRHTRAVAAAALATVALVSVVTFYTQRIAAERDRAERAAKRANVVSELLTLQLGVVDPFKVFSDNDQNEILKTVRRDFADDPAMQVEVLGTTARTLLRRGQKPAAEVLLRNALAAARDLPRATIPVAKALKDLAMLHRERGEFRAALELLARAEPIDREHAAESRGNELAVTLVEIGRNYMALEQVDRAEATFRQALDLRRTAFGPEHGEVATTLGDLADAEWHLGQVVEAERDMQLASELFARVVGREHPNVASSLVALGRIRLDRGDVAGATELFEQAVALFTRTLGPRNWRTARAAGMVGVAARVAGRLEEAEQRLGAALAVMNDDPTNNPTQIALIEIELARVRLARGDQAASAETLLRSALARQAKLYPANGWRIGSTQSLLAEALLQQKRWNDAEPLLLAARESLPETTGPRGWETAVTRERLARLYRATDRNEMAAK